MARYACIWFPFLLAEFTARKTPELREKPFVLASSQRGRMVVDSINALAYQRGITPGMVLADCKAIYPDLQMVKTPPGRTVQLLTALAEWCIGYTPVCSIDAPNGLILDITGCPHLWGGEPQYVESITSKLQGYGYTVKIAVADTIGAAWGMARFGTQSIIPPGKQLEALRPLAPDALRLEETVLARLKKLGLRQIGLFIDMPRTALKRRFGPELLQRLAQATGEEHEFLEPVKPVAAYQERLHCTEPVATAAGIGIGLEHLLQKICQRLSDEGLGLRQAVFYAYRTDGNIQKVEIGTSHPTRNAQHIARLFKDKIGAFEPDLGFEMFMLEAPTTEPVTPEQAALWEKLSHDKLKMGEFIDRIMVKTGAESVRRYLAAQHYWPERSVKEAWPLWEKPTDEWPEIPRPVHLLPRPEPIEVTAALPDYPPLLFRYRRNLYHVARSDGPERIEQEWWLASGVYRDYYCVEDEKGARFWLFRAGPYDGQPQWFIHGFFA